MSQLNMQKRSAITRLLPMVMVAVALILEATAHAAAPGITGGTGATATFNLTAQANFISQPDGAMIYSWGYGCNIAPANFNPPASKMPGANCPTMQIPGPTLIVTEGQTVTVTLTNNLPPAAGNTSILFPGFQVQAFTSGNGVLGLLTNEAPNGGTVTYTFTASSPGTRAYYRGTQSDLQVEMGLYGAVVVLPLNPPESCSAMGSLGAKNVAAEMANGEVDYRLSTAAYDHAASCYDREYLFQFSEMDPKIHQQAEEQVAALGNCSPTVPCKLNVATEPYHPAYFMINGRSMPDDMDTNYAAEYPHQPYNGNPHMHPGELVLLRIIGQGRWQHPRLPWHISGSR
jgi:FtsP/CotA-like multicopper oxidase with cupredoxin domain